MAQSSDADSFRRTATIVYYVTLAFVGLMVFGISWLGWRLGRWGGLAIGAVVGLILFAVAWFGATFFWAMSQEGG